VARQLQALGFDAAALKGGYTAWRAAYPVETKGSIRTAPHPAVVRDGAAGSPLMARPEEGRVAPRGDRGV
jgi:hypothetical protein